MSDEAIATSADGSAAGQGATAQGASAASTTDGNPSDAMMIASDGTFQPGWREKYVPEDLRADKVYDGTPNVGEMAKMLGNLQRVIGKKGLVVPGETAAPSEVDAFYKALGRPDKPDGYKFEIPKGLEEYYAPEMMTMATTRLHKEAGLNQKQFDVVMDIQRQITAEGDAEMKANPIPTYEKVLEMAMPVLKANTEKDLKAKWGEAYDERLHIANKLIADFVPDGPNKDELLKRIGNDPLVADFMATVGMTREEHKLVTGGESGRTGVMTPGQAQLRIEELAATPDYAIGKLMQVNPAAAKRLKAEIEACAKIIFAAQQQVQRVG